MTRKSKRQLEYTTATHAIERLTPSRDALRLCEQVSDGKINADEAVEALLRLYGLDKVGTNVPSARATDALPANSCGSYFC